MIGLGTAVVVVTTALAYAAAQLPGAATLGPLVLALLGGVAIAATPWGLRHRLAERRDVCLPTEVSPGVLVLPFMFGFALIAPYARSTHARRKAYSAGPQKALHDLTWGVTTSVLPMLFPKVDPRSAKAPPAQSRVRSWGRVTDLR